jgi:tRNA(Ile2) C34 agmatinyltransferase TiaS
MAWKLKYRCKNCGYEADVAPSYRSEVGRLCLQCGSDNIRIWDGKTCPKCQGEMEATGEKEFRTKITIMGFFSYRCCLLSLGC